MTANLSVGAAQGGAETESVAAPSAATIYTTPNCMQCVATKRAFDKLVVPYTVVDVSTDPYVRDLLADMGYRSAPVVITATGEHWSGFRPDRIAALNNPAVIASDATVGVTACGRATETRPPPALDGAALQWAQQMAQRSATRARARAATDTGLSL